MKYTYGSIEMDNRKIEKVYWNSCEILIYYKNWWFRLMNGDIEVHYNILYCLDCNMFVWTLIENIQ